MKKVTSRVSPPRRLSVAEAKASLSEALRAASDAPTVIHNRGSDVAVLVGVDEYERLVANERTRTQTARLLEDIESLKKHFGGGAELEAERAVIAPRNPFARARR